jgi:hypothetical protein
VFIAHTEQLPVHQFKRIKIVVKKPTLKAIHICNSQQPIHKPEIAKEYVFANAENQIGKSTNAQHCINAIAG